MPANYFCNKVNAALDMKARSRGDRSARQVCSGTKTIRSSLIETLIRTIHISADKSDKFREIMTICTKFNLIYDGWIKPQKRIYTFYSA